MIIINGLKGTGKTTLCKQIASTYDYTYINDYEILAKQNASLNDMSKIDKKHSKIICEYLLKHINEKMVVDLEYTISPTECYKHGLEKLATCIYLGYATVDYDILYKMYNENPKNKLNCEQLKDYVKQIKDKSVSYYKECMKLNIKYIDISENKNSIIDNIVKSLKTHY